jgi:hypothetical protein
MIRKVCTVHQMTGKKTLEGDTYRGLRQAVVQGRRPTGCGAQSLIQPLSTDVLNPLTRSDGGCLRRLQPMPPQCSRVPFAGVEYAVHSARIYENRVGCCGYEMRLEPV